MRFYVVRTPTSYTPANFGRSGTRTDAANSSFNHGNIIIETMALVFGAGAITTPISNDPAVNQAAVPSNSTGKVILLDDETNGLEHNIFVGFRLLLDEQGKPLAGVDKGSMDVLPVRADGSIYRMDITGGAGVSIRWYRKFQSELKSFTVNGVEFIGIPGPDGKAMPIFGRYGGPKRVTWLSILSEKVSGNLEDICSQLRIAAEEFGSIRG